jgi:putative two-component system response regulator
LGTAGDYEARQRCFFWKTMSNQSPSMQNPSLLDSVPQDAAEAIVQSLACAIEAKDFRIRRHSERVANYVKQLATAINLPPEEQQLLQHGALLHDIGNIGIADSILLKPGGLSDWEFEEVRMHPIIGETICRPLTTLRSILPLIRSHHEKLDGSGYPDALRGDQISLHVRILAVADVYDTLRCDRAYRGAFGHAEAIDILRREVARGWWQAEIVDLIEGITTPRGDFVQD